MHAQQLPFSIPQVAEVRGFVFIFVIVLLLLNYTLGHLPTFLENNLTLVRRLKWDHVAM